MFGYFLQWLARRNLFNTSCLVSLGWLVTVHTSSFVETSARDLPFCPVCGEQFLNTSQLLLCPNMPQAIEQWPLATRLSCEWMRVSECWLQAGEVGVCQDRSLLGPHPKADYYTCGQPNAAFSGPSPFLKTFKSRCWETGRWLSEQSAC